MKLLQLSLRELFLLVVIAAIGCGWWVVVSPPTPTHSTIGHVMIRLLPMPFFCLAVAVAHDSGGDVAKGSKPAHSPDSLPVGKWKVMFFNGVIEVCDISDFNLGQATVEEPSRKAEGTVSQADGSLLITFNDDRIERWTPARGRFLVEHWYPAAGYPRAAPVLGIAEHAR